MTTIVKKRITTPKQLSDEMRRHSPLKKNLVVENENDPYENYNKIMNKLYLGNKIAAKDSSFMKEKNIKPLWLIV